MRPGFPDEPALLVLIPHTDAGQSKLKKRKENIKGTNKCIHYLTHSIGYCRQRFLSCVFSYPHAIPDLSFIILNEVCYGGCEKLRINQGVSSDIRISSSTNSPIFSHPPLCTVHQLDLNNFNKICLFFLVISFKISYELLPSLSRI